MRHLFLLFLLFAPAFLLAQSGDGLGFYVKAEQLRQANQFRAAIDEYNNAIRQDPTNPRFTFQKGLCYINLRDEDNAIAAFEKTVQLKEDYIHAYTRLAWLYQRKERFDDAIETFNKAFKYEAEAGHRINYKSAIIKILYKIDRFEEAAPHIAEAKQVAPEDLQVLYYDAKYSNEHGNYAQAKASMLKAVSLLRSTNPKDIARYYYELGVAQYELGEFGEAFSAFQKANYGPYQAHISERMPEYRFAVARAYYLVYEYEKCEQILDFCLEMSKNFPLAHELKIELAKRRTDKSIVIEHTLNVIEVETDVIQKSRKYAELASLEFDSKNYAKAIEYANECMRIQTTNYNVHYIKIMAMYKSGSVEGAIAETRNLLTYSGLDFDTKAKLNFSLGLFNKKLGDKDSAIKAFKAAIYGTFKNAAKEELRRLTEGGNDAVVDAQ